jgi:fibro-slime domain-containing protein
MIKRSGALMVLLGLALSAWLFGFGVSPAMALSITGEYFDVLNNATTPGVNGAITGLSLGLVGPIGSPLVPPVGGFPNFAPNNFWSTTLGTNVSADLGVGVANGLNGGSLHVDNAAGVGLSFGGDFFAGAVGTTPGGNDNSLYRAVHWTSLFSAPGSVSFSLGADDHAWLFIDGKLAVDNGGVKPVGVVSTSGPLALGAGDHTLDLFFADVHTSQSAINFSCDGCADPAAVPEPATLLLFGTTMVGIGSVLRNRLKGRKAPEA